MRTQVSNPNGRPGQLSGTAGGGLLLLLSAVLVWAATGCLPDSPYRAGQTAERTLFDTYREPPRTLDPAVAYSANEYKIIAQIYEPPLQYHYLDRPYRLVPLTAEELPVPEPLPGGGVRYRIRLKPGIRYQEHPCFARDAAGRPLYRDLTPADLRGVRDMADFQHTGSRELRAEDYVLQVQRMADPRLGCPILATLGRYVQGLAEYSAALESDLAAQRERRRAGAGPAWSREADERARPLRLDYDAHPLPGVRALDERTWEVVLTRPYPPFPYWLAMPFFAPMPREALDFYEQGPLVERNLTLATHPVGTGPFRMARYAPDFRMELERNRNFRGEPYPDRGAPGDAEAGLLQDAGEPMPFLDHAVLVLEKEPIPRWNKFLQGWYDLSELRREAFDQAVTVGAREGAALGPGAGTPEPLALNESLRARGLGMSVEVETSTWYFAFNMQDPVVGGYDEPRRKLRQAIALAFDTGEFVQIFENGRGVPAQSPIPPGLAGHLAGAEGVDPQLFDWDEARGEARRRGLDRARSLLAQAGYPGGRGPDGGPLVLGFDSKWYGAQFATRTEWVRKQFAKLGIVMENRATDYNRFQEKVSRGDWQILEWSWLADYPDPENFLFLLYGPNGTVEHGGPNRANYASPEYDELFRNMEPMEDGPGRADLVRRLVQVYRHDRPWFNTWHPVTYGLYHGWYGNAKAGVMVLNDLKYKRVRPGLRVARQQEWNRPRWQPLAVIAAAALAAVALSARRGRRTRARAEAAS